MYGVWMARSSSDSAGASARSLTSVRLRGTRSRSARRGAEAASGRCGAMRGGRCSARRWSQADEFVADARVALARVLARCRRSDRGSPTRFAVGPARGKDAARACRQGRDASERALRRHDQTLWVPRAQCDRVPVVAGTIGR
jgi:hypothetical protein